MLTLGIRYLQGVAVGSHGEHRRVEWPPHPARVFMAMVAAHYETGAAQSEREALLWLEALPTPPEIYAPEPAPCGVVTHFVPVNDQAGPSKALMHSLPITRDRQPRVFARAALASEFAALHWPEAEATPEICAALAALCGKVTRIGHSTSLVQMTLAEQCPPDVMRWVPDEKRMTHLLRVPKAGTLAELDRAFNGEAMARYGELLVAEDEADIAARAATRAKAAAKNGSATNEAAKAASKAASEAKDAAKARRAAEFPHGEPAQRRPQISTYAGYARAEETPEISDAMGSVFSPHLAVFTLERIDGPYRALDLACTLALTDVWRKAVASHGNDSRPEAQSLLTGHALDRSPLQSAHVAFLPLGFVAHEHADGLLAGIALALPEQMAGEIRADILRVAARVCRDGLKLGRLGAWNVAPSTMARPLETLRPATWTAHPGGATQWSTVTPIAYDHHPKAKGKAEYLAEVAAMIAASCDRIGLPRPREVIVTPVSAHLGTPPSHAFPRLRRKDGSERRHTHAILLFDEPVRGPVLIGAGRYRGYGLCRPMEVAA